MIDHKKILNLTWVSLFLNPDEKASGEITSCYGRINSLSPGKQDIGRNDLLPDNLAQQTIPHTINSNASSIQSSNFHTPNSTPKWTPWIFLNLSRTDQRSRPVTIRHCCDGSSRSVPIGTIRRHFPIHHRDAMIISKTIANWQTVTTCHSCDGSSRSVPIGTIRRHFPTHHYNATIISKSIANWQTVTTRHGCDGSSRSVPIGTIRRHFHHARNTAMNIFKVLANWQTVTTRHHPSPSVTVVTGRRDPSPSRRSADIFLRTPSHNNENFLSPSQTNKRLRLVIQRHDPSPSVTDRH